MTTARVWAWVRNAKLLARMGMAVLVWSDNQATSRSAVNRISIGVANEHQGKSSLWLVSFALLCPLTQPCRFQSTPVSSDLPQFHIDLLDIERACHLSNSGLWGIVIWQF